MCAVLIKDTYPNSSGCAVRDAAGRCTGGAPGFQQQPPQTANNMVAEDKPKWRCSMTSYIGYFILLINV